MKRYTSWLLIISFLVVTIIRASLDHVDDSHKEIVVAMQKFDPELLATALSNFGPLCIFAKDLLIMKLSIQSENHVASNIRLIMSTHYEVDARAFLLSCSVMVTTIIGLSVITIRLLHNKIAEPTWMSYKTGFMSLLYAACALYKALNLDAEEKERHGLVFSKIREENQRILGDEKRMRQAIIDHPIKACCSQ